MIRAALQRAEKAAEHANEAARGALAFYIHWPFCVSKCPYCDFNSHVRADIDEAAWRQALLEDLAWEAARLPDAQVTSLFFGGGTPSLMPPRLVAALIEAADLHWGLAGDVEITLEANPSSVEAARFRLLADAGINRVSLGIQSLRDETLRFLGRAHDADEGLRALELAQETFARVSFDLIYALPGQQPDDWAAELAKALDFGTGHLSLYQLTIEPGTRFATLAARGELHPLDADEAASLYALTQQLTAAAGLPAYEISNHARPGEESRHNLAYWRYQPYAGIGPGAHGRRGGLATQRHRKPENWMAAVARNGHGICEENAIPGREAAIEALLMGLRLAEGVDLDAIATAAGSVPAQIVDDAACRRLEAHGLIQRRGEQLRVTRAGMPLLDGILAEIVRV